MAALLDRRRLRQIISSGWLHSSALFRSLLIPNFERQKPEGRHPGSCSGDWRGDFPRRLRRDSQVDPKKYMARVEKDRDQSVACGYFIVFVADLARRLIRSLFWYSLDDTLVQNVDSKSTK